MVARSRAVGSLRAQRGPEAAGDLMAGTGSLVEAAAAATLAADPTSGESYYAPPRIYP